MRYLSVSLLGCCLSLLSGSLLQAQWVQTSFPAGEVVTAMAVSGPNIFAGTSASGVIISTDNGSSWTEGAPFFTSRVNALAVMGANLFAGTQDGVFLSKDEGHSWTAAKSGLGNSIVLSFAVRDTILFAGTDVAVFASTNGGASWTRAMSDLIVGAFSALAVSGGHLFAGTLSGDVMYTSDDGFSWGGGTGLPSKTAVTCIATNGTNIFLGTDGVGIFRSIDNIATWTPTRSGLTNFNIFSIQIHDTRLFAGTGNGVFLSSDSGASWIESSTGLPSNTGMYCIAESKENLFVGTFTHGIWKRPFAEMITSVPAPSSGVTTSPALIHSSFPNPAKDNLVVHYNTNGAQSELILCNALGEQVSRAQGSNSGKQFFDVSALRTGLYCLVLHSGGARVCRTIVVVR